MATAPILNQTEQILIGACDIYMMSHDGNNELPADTVIEAESNLVGHTSGGATIDYTSEKYEVKKDYGDTVKAVTRGSKATMNFGMLQWVAENIKKLNNAIVEYSADGTDWSVTATPATDTMKRIRFDAKHQLETLICRMVHTKSNGKKIRATIFGQGGNGFNLPFGENEVVINAQLDSVKVSPDFVLEIVEEIEASQA